MKKYEYMTVDLSPSWTLNGKKKMDEYLERLNEYGSQGWTLFSGVEQWKYSVFIREIEE